MSRGSPSAVRLLSLCKDLADRPLTSLSIPLNKDCLLVTKSKPNTAPFPISMPLAKLLVDLHRLEIFLPLSATEGTSKAEVSGKLYGNIQYFLTRKYLCSVRWSTGFSDWGDQRGGSTLCDRDTFSLREQA